MKSMFLLCAFLPLMHYAWFAAIDVREGEASVHFGFHTENGQSRTEDITYNITDSAVPAKDNSTKVPETKQVEYNGGYSFISADGYEYTVLYKANKKGFQPYVTARKIKDI